jgi:hypothetical protein
MLGKVASVAAFANDANAFPSLKPKSFLPSVLGGKSGAKAPIGDIPSVGPATGINPLGGILSGGPATGINPLGGILSGGPSTGGGLLGGILSGGPSIGGTPDPRIEMKDH